MEPKTEMGNVSLALPSIHPMIGINSLPATDHQPEYAAHCATPAADQGLVDGAWRWPGLPQSIFICSMSHLHRRDVWRGRSACGSAHEHTPGLIGRMRCRGLTGRANLIFLDFRAGWPEYAAMAPSASVGNAALSESARDRFTQTGVALDVRRPIAYRRSMHTK
jgi:hypothetical protein